MKKSFIIAMAFLLALSPFNAPLAEKQSSGTLSLRAHTLQVYVGDTLKLSAECSDPTVSLEGLVYATDRPKCATVDETGLLTAISPGKANITVKTADAQHSDTLTFRIEIAPESVKITAKKLTITVGKTTKLSASVLPKAAANRSVLWESSNGLIATVSSEGVVTGVGPGSVTITASSAARPDILSTKEIQVIQLAGKITLTAETSSIFAGETLALNCVFEPKNVSNQEVTFKSDKTRVATVDKEGVITGVKAGKATITATAKDGSKKTAKFVIQVIQPVEGVYLSKDEIALGVGDTKSIVATLEPENATNKNMTWVSDDPTVATVTGTTNKAKVTVHAWGEAVITGTTEDGGYTTDLYVSGGFERFALRLLKSYRDEKGKLHLVIYNESNLDIGGIDVAIKGFDANNQPIAMSNPTGPMIESEEEGVGIEPFDIPEGGFIKDPMICNGLMYYNLNPGQQADLRDIQWVWPLDSMLSAPGLSVAITGYAHSDFYKFTISQNHWYWVPVE